KYGADTARLYTMFTAPPEATLEWNDAAVEGSYRFLRRVWNFGVKLSAIDSVAADASVAGASDLKDVNFGKEAKALRLDIHTVLKQVGYDYQRMQYNTVVSGSMKLLNALENVAPTLGTDVSSLPPEGALRLRPGKAGSATPAGEDGAPQRAVDAGLAFALREGMGILLRCLYPATPHVAHTLWSDLGFATDHGELLDAPWPEVDPAALVQEEIELVLQINGKLRGAVTVPAGADKATIEAAALATEAFVKQAAGALAKKVIVVPGRLVNIVI
ncbi:MAG: class I tRNA ligase family protein, partial [Polaromonas sp.]|nr:class I tRNA ligase family protein [Polaromonas sp.]